MVSFLLSFLVAQAVTEYSGLNLTSIMLNEFNKIKNRTDFDPATIKSHLKYRYDDQPKRLNVSVEVFSPMEIVGLRQLQLKEVDVDLKPMPMQIDLSLKYHIDKLKALGNYKLKGRALTMVPIKGQGPFYIQMEDIRGFVNMTIAHNGTQFMVESLKFDLHFNKLKHYFSNLIFKGLSRVTNTVMNGFSKQLVYKVLIKNESVMNDVKRRLSSIIDRRLYKLHSNIMDYIGSYVGLKSSSSSDSD